MLYFPFSCYCYCGLQVFAKDGKRLELRLRPDDPFCKPACADRQESTSLVLRVRKRKKKKNHQPEQENASETGAAGGKEEDEYEYDTKILGYSDVTYSFSSRLFQCYHGKRCISKY